MWTGYYITGSFVWTGCYMTVICSCVDVIWLVFVQVCELGVMWLDLFNVCESMTATCSLVDSDVLIQLVQVCELGFMVSIYSSV